jgi:hypothetical protein
VQIGPLAAIRTENIQLDGHGEGPTIDGQLAQSYDPATLRLGPLSVIGSDTTIATMSNMEAPWSDVAAVIDTSGLNFNFGTIVAGAEFENGHNNSICQVNIDPASSGSGNGTLVNVGRLSSVGDGGLHIEGGSTGATLVNDGVIDVGAWANIDATTIGSGTMILEKPSLYQLGFVGSTLEISGNVGRGQTVDFSAGGDYLTLDKPREFDGIIKGFVTAPPYSSNYLANDFAGYIDLRGVDSTGFSYKGTPEGGTLTVNTTSSPPVTLRFTGDYQPQAGSFNLTGTGQGSEITFTPAVQSIDVSEANGQNAPTTGINTFAITAPGLEDVEFAVFRGDKATEDWQTAALDAGGHGSITADLAAGQWVNVIGLSSGPASSSDFDHQGWSAQAAPGPAAATTAHLMAVPTIQQAVISHAS